MAVREFTDSSGRQWRAWDIKPESIHPQTKAEDYLADCYITGWIVFETVAGDEKRRLCPWPIRWASESEEGLRELLGQAELVPPHKMRAERLPVIEWPSPSAMAAAPEAEEKPDITDLNVVRSFRYPGGRLWTVSVVSYPERGGPPVLRYTAGVRSIDLRTWPKDWADQHDDRLVTMLRLGAPRRPRPVGPDTPRRRWNDQPESLGV